jgi:hypothetical protein
MRMSTPVHIDTGDDLLEERAEENSPTQSQADTDEERQSTSPHGFPLPPGQGTSFKFDPDAMTALDQRRYKEFRMMAEDSLHASKSYGPTLTSPRVGGIDHNGVWTGLGMLEAGEEPNSHNCMRAFTTRGTKELTALGKIHEYCKAGIVDKDVLFALSHEKEVKPLILCIKTLLERIEQCGLEGVFMIVRPTSRDPLHMLKTPARC